MRLSLLISLECLRAPYIWASDNPMIGLDCSGFVQYVLKKLGLLEENKDHTAQAIYNSLLFKLMNSSEVESDCVLFFGEDVENIKHVAISVNSEWMVEAAHGGPTIASASDAIAKGAKVEFNRIDRRYDLVACLKIGSQNIE